jgi:hypothetical protein
MKRRRDADSAPTPEREEHPTIETFERVFDKGVVIVVDDPDDRHRKVVNGSLAGLDRLHVEANVAIHPWPGKFFKRADDE